MAKKKTPSWADVQKKLRNFDNTQLLGLIEDLYRLSESNKEFFNTRFSLPEDPLASYKRIIQGALHPYLEDNEHLDIMKAESAVDQYTNASDNANCKTELRIFFVECGNNFTLSYGYADDDLHDSVIDMYEKAIQCVIELDKEWQNTFRQRLHDIVDSARSIGWGYHDALTRLYKKSFPAD